MRQAFILARQHGATAWKMVSGPEADYLKTTAEFRALLALTEHPEIAEARLYTAEPDRTVRLGQAAVPVSGKKARS